MIKKCKCGIEFEVKASEVKRGGGKYCSKKCRAEYSKGSSNPHYKGGIIVKKGVRYILSPDHPNCDSGGYIAEHRLVMENYLKEKDPQSIYLINGKYLNREVQVHHINGNILDNNIINLRPILK